MGCVSHEKESVRFVFESSQLYSRTNETLRIIKSWYDKSCRMSHDQLCKRFDLSPFITHFLMDDVRRKMAEDL